MAARVGEFFAKVAGHHAQHIGVNPLRTKALETLKLVQEAEAAGTVLIKGNASVDIFPTYQPLVEAHTRAIKDVSNPPQNNYGMPMAHPRLAAVLSDYLAKYNGSDQQIDPSRIFTVSGGCSNVQNTVLHVLNRQGELMFGVTEPFFVISEGIANTQGVDTQRVGFSIDGSLAKAEVDGFFKTTLDIEKTPLFLATSGNPDGQIPDENYADQLAASLERNPGALLGLDHLYNPMTHGNQPSQTLLDRFVTAPNAFHFTSFGKPLGSTQDRVGIGVLPADQGLIEAVKQTLAFQNASSPAAPQIALAEVLEDYENTNAFLDSRKAILHERSNYVAMRVAKIGTDKVTMQPIQAGIYGLLDVSKLGVNGDQFADLCFKIGLVINDATVLGAPNHVRISIGDDVLPAVFDKIEEAVALLIDNGFDGAIKIAEEISGESNA